ncbi:hypothetical protein ACIPW5_04225 [Streptomyces sp. NPDC090077]|uniref:hypothetical protein n=1 Tax=Streptomyces sp. NPDC090077 TaxID=3365938 RepID=UPI0037FD744D
MERGTSEPALPHALPNPGQDDVRERVTNLLTTSDPPAVIAIVGPLGSGKSTILNGLAAGRRVLGARQDDLDAALREASDSAHPVVYVDDADGPGLGGMPRERLRGSDGREVNVVLASRHPLPGTTTVRVPSWTGPQVRELAASLGVTAGLDLVVALAGGLPLVAAALSRALLAPTPPEVPGAVADRALRELLAEVPLDRPLSDVVDVLAAIGRADEELLSELVEPAGAPDWFASLTDLALITVTECGPAVVEPYRSLLDLRYRWRRPVAHRAAITRAASRNLRLLDATTDESRRQALAEHALHLTDDPVIRQALFPPAPRLPAVRPARSGDHDRILALADQWARSLGHSTVRTGRLLDAWLRHTPDGFHVVCDHADEAVGMSYTPLLDDASMAVIEPVTRQHTDRLALGAGGSFIGMAAYEDGRPEAHAALLRQILADGIARRRMVVATPSPAYQGLVRRLGFGFVGTPRGDTCDGGRAAEIHELAFPTPDSLTAWLGRIAATGLTTSPSPTLRWYVAEVRRALEHLDDPVRLARSPLLASTAAPTPTSLRRVLLDAIGALSASDDPRTAQAGRILDAYYVRRRSDHVGVAHRLHLSRATYFRRLDHGLTRIAESTFTGNRTW